MSALQRNDRHNVDRAELKLIRVGHALWAMMKRDRAKNGGYLLICPRSPRTGSYDIKIT